MINLSQLVLETNAAYTSSKQCTKNDFKTMCILVFWHIKFNLFENAYSDIKLTKSFQSIKSTQWPCESIYNKCLVLRLWYSLYIILSWWFVTHINADSLALKVINFRSAQTDSWLLINPSSPEHFSQTY